MPINFPFKRKNAPSAPITEGETNNPVETDTKPTLNGFGLNGAVIGKEQIREAYQTLLTYKQGKTNLEKRIIDDQQWYRMRHWEQMRGRKAEQIEPTSGWLFNSIANKHADAMDNFPSPNILPREADDQAEAKKLSSIIPVVLDQDNFEQTYSEIADYKLKFGCGVYGVYWDSSKLNGLGDISIRKVDLLSLFWESGITDIQKSRNVFSVELVDNDILIAQYPQLKDRLGTAVVQVSEYVYDDAVDTTKKSAVIDWYYKRNINGKTVLHYCKFVNEEVLYASEDDPNCVDGFYTHGMYPFVFDVLFDLEGTPTGFGYIDIGKNAQEFIDRGNQAIMENMLANSKPRYFVKDDGAVNVEDYADMTKDFIRVDGQLGQDSILPIIGKPLNEIYVSVINNKIDELKEVTGNRDISTGGSASGVTAASAIAAMQEAGSKLSRDANKASYRAYRQVILMVIELIRQFYDMPRCFRIMGTQGTMQFIQYSNSALQAQAQGMDFGLDLGMRLPVFDVEVNASKQSPYSKMAQNELALQFYQAGFFNPMMSTQALMCLDMMDFDRKEMIMQKIMQAGQAYALQQAMMMQTPMGAPVPTGEKPEMPEGEGKESSVTQKARERVANSTDPT